MKITNAISPEELRRWCEADDRQAARLVAANWAMIAAIFTGVALWTNPLSIVLGIVLLGGRQLGLAVLMHDCGHRTLFANRKANAWVGQWLCAYPVMTDMERYASGHINHHRYAGSERDPDLPNYQAYPIGRDSFRRKIVRDLTGQTGVKLLAGRFRNRDALFGSQLGSSGTGGFVVVSLAMFAVLHAFGHGALYWMWPAAFLTSYLLFAPPAPDRRTRRRSRPVRPGPKAPHPHHDRPLVGTAVRGAEFREFPPRAPSGGRGAVLPAAELPCAIAGTTGLRSHELPCELLGRPSKRNDTCVSRIECIWRRMTSRTRCSAPGFSYFPRPPAEGLGTPVRRRRAHLD